MIAGTLELQMRADIAQLKTDMAAARGVVTNATQGIERAASAARTALGALGLSLGVGAFISMIKGSIDAADHLNDLSKSTALTVEQLSGLRIAAKQSGSDLDGVAQSITKLAQNMGKDAEKFKQAGITARDPLEAFKQLADLFVAIEDPQTRAALGAATLGKNWATAAPLLAEGGAAIGEMVDKGTRLSGVTAELAKQSDAFNDKLVLLTGTNSIMNSVTGQLLPLLNKLAGDMLEAKEQSSGMNSGFTILLDTFKLAVILGGMVAKTFQAIGTAAGAQAAQLAALARGDFSGAMLIRKEALADLAKMPGDFLKWRDSILAVGTAAQVAASKLDSMDQVSRRMASQAAAAARAESEAAAKRAQALIGGTGSAGSAKKLIDEIAAHNKRMRDLDSKGWIAKIEADIREYEDGLAAQRKLDEDSNADRLKLDAAFFAEKERLRKVDEAGWIAYIEATTAEYEAGLLAIHAATKSNAEISDEAKKAMAEYLDPAKAKSFGDALSAAFGSAGSALGKLINTLEDYGQKMAEIEKMRATNAKINDPAIRAANEIKLAEQSANAQISAYGDMAAAAKGFFETGSSGYKALEAAERVFRAFELASAIQNMLTKSGLLSTFTGLFVASKATETAATIASVAPDVAASMAKGTAAAAAGVANQAQGDPYTAWARMAAMAAVMVGLGFAVSGSFGGGGGGGQTTAQRQREQGTGTVLGDAEAKSASIQNALNAILQIDTLGLTNTNRMVESLRSIDAGIDKLAISFYRAGITSGSGNDYATGTTHNADAFGGTGFTPIAQRFRDWVFGVVETSIINSGIGLSGTLRQQFLDPIIDNLANYVQGINSFFTVSVADSGIFGMGGSTTNHDEWRALDPKVVSQVRGLLNNIVDSVENAARILGVWTPQLREALMNIPLDVQLSVEGLKGDELTAAVNAFFSSIADRIALGLPTFSTGTFQFDSAAFFEEFQRAGEGAFETLVRVATQFDVVSHTMAALGTPLAGVSMGTLAFSDTLVTLMGGIDKFQQSMASYVSHYYSPTEQRGMTGTALNSEFSSMGFETPTDLAGFRKLMEGIDRTSESGAELYARMLTIEGTFYDFATQIVGLDGALHSLDDVAAQHMSLEEEYAVLTGQRTAQSIEREHRMAEAIDNTSLAQLQAIFVEEDRQAGLAKQAAQNEARFDLETQLFNLTHSEAEVLEHSRSLRMTELALKEQELGMAPGTLQAIQKQIDAQTDLNKAREEEKAALKTTSDLEGRLGVLRGDYTQKELDRAREWQAAASDTDRVLLSQIYAQEDLAEATRKTTEALDEATSSQQSLWDQFATDAQKAERATRTVNDGFAALGIAVPQSREMFANLVASIDPATTAGQAMLDALKAIAPAFATVTSAAMTMIGTLYGATPAGPPPPGAVWVTLPDGTGYWMVPPGAGGGADNSNADSIARQRRQLEIELQRALGNDEIALMMERADQLAALDASLRGLQQQVWDALDAAKLRAATEAWIGTLQDFLRGLTLDSTLSPLTARQRFSAAEAQYMQDYLLAGSGDAAARERYTAEAEAYLREALAMFGRGSTEYQAIFRDIQMQTQGLIDQGLTPTAATTVGDVNKTLLTGQESAKEQADALIETVRTLANKVDTLTRRVEDSTTAEAAGTEAIVDAIEGVGRKTATEIANRVPGGALS